MASRWLAIALLCSTVGCLPQTFHCDSASECVRGDTAGFCEASGACSFTDPSCASGRRFGSPQSTCVNANDASAPTADLGTTMRDASAVAPGYTSCPTTPEPVNLETDPSHCGACDVACGVAEVCVNGACQLTCPSPLALCAASQIDDGGIAPAFCADIAHDASNCGACGNACASGATCVAGVCRFACGGEYCAPGLDCTITSDSGGNLVFACGLSNCGLVQCCSNAGNVCSGQTNNSFDCVSADDINNGPDCSAPLATSTPLCVDTNTDSTNCGGCGIVCLADESCLDGYCRQNCNGAPVDTTSDNGNCGGCGISCVPTRTLCMNSACTCEGVTPTTCNGICYDAYVDPNHCGDCTTVCAAPAPYCNLGACSATAVATDCKALIANAPGTPSGVYHIMPATASAPYEVFCDMDTDGGGWTLVMKLDGTRTTFNYAANYWTTPQTYNVTDATLDTSEAKLESFNEVPFSQLRLGMTQSGTTRYLELSKSASSLLSLFASNTFVATTLGETSWLSLLSQAYLQAHCLREGFNDVPNTSFAHARLGIVANQEDDCDSPDSVIGFGVTGDGCGASAVSVGNIATCTGDGHTNSAIAAFGYIFVR